VLEPLHARPTRAPLIGHEEKSTMYPRPACRGDSSPVDSIYELSLGSTAELEHHFARIAQDATISRTRRDAVCRWAWRIYKLPWRPILQLPGAGENGYRDDTATVSVSAY
jgi:hypothetical protein